MSAGIEKIITSQMLVAFTMVGIHAGHLDADIHLGSRGFLLIVTKTAFEIIEAP